MDDGGVDRGRYRMRYSRRVLILVVLDDGGVATRRPEGNAVAVLILVVLDDGGVGKDSCQDTHFVVLILVVLDDGGVARGEENNLISISS